MQIQEYISLAPLTTMRVGGRARYFAEFDTLEELGESLTFARRQKLPWMLLGGGSNLVLDDRDYPGIVLAIKHQRFDWDMKTHEVIVGTGVMMADLVRETTEHGWTGIEWAGGLPGSVGGAIRGNAGAFGSEIQDVVRRVTAIDAATGKERIFSPAECGFSYRTSRFKSEPLIIWEARLGFTHGDPAELVRIREEKIRYRQTHHPQAPSVGSIFQNLYVRDLPSDFFSRFPELREKIRGEKIGAGSLLERLKMKGLKVGGAMISYEHANIVVNTGEATAVDVRALVAKMKEAVQKHYGITLHEEPQFVINM